MKTLPNFRRSRGFTLIELMVAMTITTIIVSVLVSITAISLDTWTRSRSELRAARQAKAMVDTMARDFEALVTRRGNNFQWLHAEAPVQPPGPTSMPSSNASELIFFTAATDRYEGSINTTNDKGGDVSCVGYRLQYQDPIDGSQNNFATFGLYRLLVNPDETFQNLLGKPDLDTAFSTYDAQINQVENFVCENIYQFTITFNVEITRATGNTSTKLTVPVSLGSAGGGAGRVDTLKIMGTGLDLPRAPSGMATLDELKAGRIAAVEISLTVLSDAGMEQLRRRTFQNETQKAEFLTKNSFQYSKLVELPGM